MLKKGDKTGKRKKKIEFMKKLHLLELKLIWLLNPRSLLNNKSYRGIALALILPDLGKSDHLIDVITKRSEKNRLELSVRSKETFFLKYYPYYKFFQMYKASCHGLYDSSRELKKWLLFFLHKIWDKRLRITEVNDVVHLQ